MANDKVFMSDITRTLNNLNNNLYDLLTVDPVKPLSITTNKCSSCDFVPKTDKYFIPKRILRPKVKTVRDIRNLFEKEISSNLSLDIEKQQNVLLRKIRGGSSKDEKTVLFAKDMLKNEQPISRMSWQMVVNINPDNSAYPSQYVLWNGKCILVNGSRGGKSKFIYKYDLAKRRTSVLQRYKFKNTNFINKSLLKHSLNVKFKPGPLSKKKQLDISYQKYNIGEVQLVNLPKPALDVTPEYGKPIETSVTNYLQNLRDANGIISDKWAEFAVSVLGTKENGRAVQLNKGSRVTFDLGYKNDQRRILVRYDVDKFSNRQKEDQTFLNFYTENEEVTKQNVQKILDEMLTSVEISLMENKMYTGEDYPREPDTGDTNNSYDSRHKPKSKRKGQSELHRLDVTVIRLCDTQEKKKTDTCRKSFCTLGCICDSLLCSFRLKSHCGHVECMFECKCDFNKCNLHSYFEGDIIPGLANLDKENNSKLTKEEQKFHQTVILSGEKSILLKSQRRNWKAPEKYAEFYSNMSLKAKKDIKRILSVVEVKLNCGNIEPWCMIHNLYKCFCKGKFTQKLSNNISNDGTEVVDGEQSDTKLSSFENLEVGVNCNNNETTSKSFLIPIINYATNHDNQSSKSFTEGADNSLNNTSQKCARIKAYKKRKYSDVFYLNANKKIMELERNDHGLHKRMMEILKIDENSEIKKPKNDSNISSVTDLSSLTILDQRSQGNEAVDKPHDAVNKLCEKVDKPLEAIDKPYEPVHKPLEAVHKLLEAVHKPLEAVDKPHDAVDKSLEAVDTPHEAVDKPQSVMSDETRNKLPASPTYHELTGDVISTQFTSPANHNLNNKLRAWLEPSLKMYRQRFSKGFFKTGLEPPTAGKIALYPWDFIVNRYHEKKNLFLVTNNKPFRIFMAVDHRNAMFNNCLDIRSIEDLDNYPISVKNIVTKEVDRLTDQLCILRGLNFCWELVGSVKKVCDHKNLDIDSNVREMSSNTDVRSPQNQASCTVSSAGPVNDTPSPIPLENKTEQSKWFVMIIENDFSEIQFYNRGFFVKYDSIIKAINVARVSDKTVRLSSQKCNEGNTDPQFGIYAVPNADEYCVFIGPYEKYESLGIETIKTRIRNQNIKTRGVWITTDKIDNFRVIDNPLSFMSQVNLEHGQILDDSSQNETINHSVPSVSITSAVKTKENSKVVKLVKPITITKTNNFYHLTPSGFLKPISASPEKQISKTPIIMKKRLSLDIDTNSSNSPLMYRTFIPQLNENNKYSRMEERQKTSSNRPIAEIAPQVKVIESSRESNNIQPKASGRRKFEGGMFILKPEEINNKSLGHQISYTQTSIEANTISKVADNEIDMDIENFLANSVECSAPNTDVLVISDDEDYCYKETLDKISTKHVWIVCKNVKKIGWISGRQDAYGNLSFEFPGFKYTDFYPVKEAFAKITQVLARKIYIPEDINLVWSVKETKKGFQKLKKLKEKDLNPNYVLTKSGLIHKSRLSQRSNKKIKVKAYSKAASGRKGTAKCLPKDKMDMQVMKSSISEMDVKSNLLLKEGEQLLNETILKRGELSDSFSIMSNESRQKISDRLRSIISNENSS